MQKFMQESFITTLHWHIGIDANFLTGIMSFAYLASVLVECRVIRTEPQRPGLSYRLPRCRPQRLRPPYPWGLKRTLLAAPTPA